MTADRDAHLAVLRRTAMFSQLDDDTHLNTVLDRCPARRYPAGQAVFSPSQPAEAFFVVLAGHVKVYKLSESGAEQILHLYGPAQTVAEAAMFRRIAYPAWAEAVEDATLLVVRRSVLAELIAAGPELAMGMIAGLSDKLREFNRLLEAVTLKDVVARVAGALLARAPAGANTFRLPQTKRHLAGQLGTTPETLSRTLGKLKAGGAIDVAGRQITLLDRDRLSDAADRGADAL